MNHADPLFSYSKAAFSLKLRLLLVATAMMWLANPGAVSGQQHEPDLQWKTLKTPHYSVHFPAGYERIGKKIARICEELYQPVSQSLNYFPHRTQLVVHTRSDISNGFVVQLPWRMELFITEPQDNLFGSNEDWLRILIAHEMTHIVQARKVRGISRLSYPFFGELNSLWHNATPNWYVEGFATLNETRYTDGGRGRNAFHRMKMHAPILNQDPWKLASSSFASRKRMPRDMSYVTGYYLTDYITRHYGAGTWAAILDAYNANPLLGFSHAVDKITGQKPEAHYRGLLAEFDAESTDGRAKARKWRVVTTPENQLSPRWDGETIVYFRSSYDDLPEIARLSENGGHQQIVQRALFGSENALDIGERFLVWAEASPHPRYNATEYASLMRLDRQTGSIQAVSEAERVYSPDLTPDEKRVVAVQTALPGNRLVIIEMADGAVTTELQIAGAVLLNPRWAADGRQIAFAIKDSSDSQDIAIWDTQTGQWRRLYPADRSHDNSPCWSPDGQFVFFTSDRSGLFNIWAVDVQSGQRWMVTDTETGAFSPDVTADGTKLSFTVYTEMGLQIRSIHIDRKKWLADSTIAKTSAQLRDAPLPLPLQTRFANPAVAVDTSAWQISSYRAAGQILRPQGWFPWAVEDENGTAIGAYALSADALHRHDWIGFVAFSPANFKPSWDVAYNYRRWLPELTLRSYSDADEIGVLRGQNGSLFDGWLRNTGLEISAAVPLTLSRNVYTTSVRPMLGIKGENIDLFARGRTTDVANLEIERGVAQYRGYKAGVQFFHAAQTFRDVVPHKAIAFSAIADWSSSFLKSDLRAQQLSGVLNLFIPALLKHHALQGQASYTTRGGNFGFDSFRSYPIGFGDPGHRKLLRLKAAYHFPVAYTEWQLPFLPAYVHYLAGAFFFDWGTSWNHGSGTQLWAENDRASAGAVLSANVTLFQTIATRVGLAVFYQDGKTKMTIEPIIGINF